MFDVCFLLLANCDVWYVEYVVLCICCCSFSVRDVFLFVELCVLFAATCVLLVLLLLVV